MPKDRYRTTDRVWLRDVLGIDAFVQVYDSGDGSLSLLISKPSGQEWVELKEHDFLKGVLDERDSGTVS